MAYMRRRLLVEMLLKYYIWVLLYIKVVDIVEENICFTVMLSLVSRDPSFPIWRAIVGCPVLKLSSAHLCVERCEKWHLFRQVQMITLLQLSFNYKRLFFYHTNANHYMTTRQKSFQRFENWKASGLPCVQSSWVGFIEQCLNVWIDQKLFTHGVFGEFFSAQTTMQSHMT